MNNGFVSLHRKILDWEWYQDSVVKGVFIHLLLKANFTDKKWQGITIKRGETITSYEHLSNELSGRYNKVSIQQVRTALDKLKSTGELTIKTTNRYSLVSIINYDEYQQPNNQENKQLTSNQQTDNKQITTTNKDNKDNNENKDNNLNISKDISLKTEYGNKYINELMEYMKTTLELPKLNGTIKNNRNQAYNLLKEFKKTYNVDDDIAIDKIKKVISIIPRHEFWNGKINDFSSLKRNWINLVKSLKEEKQNARNKFATMD